MPRLDQEVHPHCPYRSANHMPEFKRVVVDVLDAYPPYHAYLSSGAWA
jgi:hypothetical protein